MERFFLKGREIHPDIRRERTSISMSNVLTDVEDYNREHSGSYALGYSMYYYYLTYGTLLGAVDDLKLLTVDGVMPSEESLSDGSYPLTTNYFAVIREDEPEDSSARRLTEYLVQRRGTGSHSLRRIWRTVNCNILIRKFMENMKIMMFFCLAALTVLLILQILQIFRKQAGLGAAVVLAR